jgi:CBS domain-containing protein
MQIGPVVSRALLMVEPRDSIAEAARKITERDILRAVAAGADLETAPVEDYMTHNAITAFEDWDLREAAERMTSGGFRHLIVLSMGGQVEGVLSIRDLMRALLQESTPGGSQ